MFALYPIQQVCVHHLRIRTYSIRETWDLSHTIKAFLRTIETAQAEPRAEKRQLLLRTPARQIGPHTLRPPLFADRYKGRGGNLWLRLFLAECHFCGDVGRKRTLALTRSTDYSFESIASSARDPKNKRRLAAKPLLLGTWGDVICDRRTSQQQQ